MLWQQPWSPGQSTSHLGPAGQGWASTCPRSASRQVSGGGGNFHFKKIGLNVKNLRKAFFPRLPTQLVRSLISKLIFLFLHNLSHTFAFQLK